ncbi:hypothetical protein [uncultured Bacteroides sp.]|uniref:hypothetical protein n=1 Tax=uncultured Bacteroides sp. TaxID=162156 RepID=UPI002AA63C89|nr:hypothetical protein [uncultured Bacteroides sp.]
MIKIERIKIRTFSIVEKGMISHENIGEGRLIPALVLDVEGNQDIIDLFKAHDSINAGDVVMNWTQDFFKREDLIFKMTFSKPMNIEFGIRINIEQNYIFIDGIIQSKGLYLRAGKMGEKVSQVTEDTILVEVPDMNMKAIWNEMIQKKVAKSYRSNGYSKSEARINAKQHIQSLREIWKIRRK